MKATRQSLMMPNGEDIETFTLQNENGYTLKAMSLGATVTEFWMPDKHGTSKNILLSPPSVNDYRKDRVYYGSVVGPVAGRVSDGHLMLGDTTYTLEENEGNNHLHGGTHGFDTLLWQSELETSETEATVQFTLSYEGKKGQVPGRYDLRVRYTLTEQNEWFIRYETSPMAQGLLNPSNHAYFNLSGSKSSVLAHTLQLKSDNILLLDKEGVPRGEKLDVTGTPFDFRNEKSIEDAVQSHHPQILSAKGLDHPFLLSKVKEQIILKEGKSGRTMKIHTDREAVVVYTHNHETDSLGIKPWSGIAFETQMVPNAIHLKDYRDSVILKENQPFVSETRYSFSIKN